MSDLEPEIHERALPSRIARLRQLAEAEQVVFGAQLQGAIDQHLTTYEGVIEALIESHRALADRSDLEIDSETRWTAMWLLAGRCLGISGVLLHDLRGGFGAEAVGTLRALHEATQLLVALSFHEEENDLRRWLAGKDVSPGRARAIVGKQQALALRLMRDAGVEPDGGDVVELSLQIYRVLTRSAHHQRGGFTESVSVPLREFVYGPHPDAITRASHVTFGGELLEEVVIVVGSAVVDMLGQPDRRAIARPLQEAMATVRELYPLPES